MDKNNKLSKRKTVQLSFQDTVTEAIESEGEEVKLPEESIEDSIAMAENTEALLEVGRVMAESINQQMDAVRQYSIDREETTLQRFERIIEGQTKYNRQGVEMLCNELEGLRIERETSRGMPIQKLPSYDGTNLTVDEWQDRCEAVLVCNKWDTQTMLAAMPIYLTGIAKRAFDSLSDEEKISKRAFFASMRIKIDPQSEKKNKELFLLARRGSTETVTSFIDRCREHIRRSGGNPQDSFANDMLRLKAIESLNVTDRKIINATIGCDEELEKLIVKADSMLSTSNNMIGAVTCQEIRNVKQGPSGYCQNMSAGGHLVAPTRNKKTVCYRCRKAGHIRRECTEIDPDHELPLQFYRKDGQSQHQNFQFNPANENIHELCASPNSNLYFQPNVPIHPVLPTGIGPIQSNADMSYHQGVNTPAVDDHQTMRNEQGASCPEMQNGKLPDRANEVERDKQNLQMPPPHQRGRDPSLY